MKREDEFATDPRFHWNSKRRRGSRLHACLTGLFLLPS
jgi:hypothetical protein